MPRCNRDVLLAVYLIRHWCRGNLASQVRLPKKCAGSRIKRVKVTLAPAGKKKVRCRRENSTVGHVRHRKLPLLLTGTRIQCNNLAVADGVGPYVEGAAANARHVGRARNRTRGPSSYEATSFFVFLRLLHKHTRVVFPRRYVEEACPRTIRGRVPVCAALNARECRQAWGLWRQDRSPFCIESARPVHLHEKMAGKELTRHTIENIEESVAIGPQHHLAWSTIPIHIDQHGDLNRIVVVKIVESELKKPLELS